jgi:hypothetical protein
MLASVPTGAFLLLSARRLRAVGPIVFAAILLLLFGTAAGAVYGAVHAWDAIRPLRFVRDDLSRLSMSDAFSRYFFDEVGRLRLPEMLAAINELAQSCERHSSEAPGGVHDSRQTSLRRHLARCHGLSWRLWRCRGGSPEAIRRAAQRSHAHHR